MRSWPRPRPWRKNRSTPWPRPSPTPLRPKIWPCPGWMTSRPCRAWGWRPLSTARRRSWETSPFSLARASPPRTSSTTRTSCPGKAKPPFSWPWRANPGGDRRGRHPEAGAAQTVAALKEMGLKILLLSGDNKMTAAAVAKSIGIEDVLAEVLPGDKAKKVAELQADGRSGGHGGGRHQRRPGPGPGRRRHRPGHRRRRGPRRPRT